MKVVDDQKINEILAKREIPDTRQVKDILSHASERKGLTLEEAAILLEVKEQSLWEAIFATAARVKDEIYGERLVFFAPLYLSNYCANDCEYCNFHLRNNNMLRKKLSVVEIEEQAKLLIAMGHKRILLEAGEDPVQNPVDYVLEAIDAIYKIKLGNGNIRRINVNIAATTVKNYRRLKQAEIGTYQLFQETYHRPTYEKLHRGPKADYDRQITAHFRAFEGGIDDLGLGVLFGLYDYRFEVLALLSHAQKMDKELGTGPHTISVPRFCSADSVNYSLVYPVSDEDFLRLIAVLRLAVPYTGMIITTRERPEIRARAFRIGISQTSAASRTAPGGYGKEEAGNQFDIADHRSLHEVIAGVLETGLMPSFCTSCYRRGRTGEKFMDLAKPGDIQNFCRPNALLTFKEYLLDYAVDGVIAKGNWLIDRYFGEIPDPKIKAETLSRLKRIEAGERDIFF